MIVTGHNGEIELAGKVVIVRAKRSFWQQSNEARIPVSRIVSINFKKAGIMPGFVHFNSGDGGGFGGPQWEAADGKNGLQFLVKQQAEFERLRDAVEELMV